MKTLIAYTTNHGCTEKCAMKVKMQLNQDTELLDLKHSRSIDLNKYETIVIGGSIHAGRIQNRVKKFCQQNLELLRSKKVGLFLCCMEEGETAEKQFINAFPGELIQHSSASGIFGGEFNFERMNFIEKTIIKKVAKVDQNISKIDENSIAEFVRAIEQ